MCFVLLLFQQLALEQYTVPQWAAAGCACLCICSKCVQEKLIGGSCPSYLLMTHCVTAYVTHRERCPGRASADGGADSCNPKQQQRHNHHHKHHVNQVWVVWCACLLWLLTFSHRPALCLALPQLQQHCLSIFCAGLRPRGVVKPCCCQALRVGVCPIYACHVSRRANLQGNPPSGKAGVRVRLSAVVGRSCACCCVLFVLAPVWHVVSYS